MNLKILVAYHKPFKLVRNKIFVPVHVGRDVAFAKSKDGVISKQDMDWLLKNTIGDNTGDNISKLNRDFCEMTAVYWAWKNYDKLGNPDYIGLCHYRTFLNFGKVYVRGILDENTIVAPKLDNYLRWHPNIIGPDLSGIDIKRYPGLSWANDKFLHDGLIYYKNIFIMPQKIFMQYCEFVFGVLFDIYNSETEHEPRRMGYNAEYLTSYFIMMMQNCGVNVTELKFSSSPRYSIFGQIKNFIKHIKNKSGVAKK